MVRNSCRKEEKEGNVDAVEFNYIYNKLVGKIKERLNSSPKEQTVEEDGQGITDVDENK